MTVPASWLHHRVQRPRSQRGAALAITSVLLLIVTLLGVAGLVAASLELQMSGNFQYQERAFQAAEFAIEQALHSAPLSTAHTYTNPKSFPAVGTEAVVPGSAPDSYTYRLFFDTGAGATLLPEGSGAGTTLLAYHFVIVGTGSSLRGTQSTHTQGFYVVGSAACADALVACTFDGAERRKTFWFQQGAE